LRKSGTVKEDEVLNVRRVTGAQLSRLMRVTKQAIAKWSCPRNQDGKTFDLPTVIAWRVSQLERKIAAGPASADAELRRYRAAKAKLAEFDLARREKELVEVDVVSNRWGRTLVHFRNVLLAMPSRMAPILEGRDAPAVASALEAEIRSVLAEIAEVDYSGDT